MSTSSAPMTRPMSAHLDSQPSSSTQIFQGSMGLHQNNYKNGQFTKSCNKVNERTIVEVFRNFRDQCMLKLKDGITIPTAKPKSPSKVELPKDKECQGNGDVQTTLDTLRLDDLPFYCKIVILSKLDTTDIRHLSVASRLWSEVCSDQILWRELLYRDMVTWHSIGHKSYPLQALRDFCEKFDHIESKVTVTEDLKDVEDGIPAAAYDLHTRLSSRKNINFKALYFHTSYQRHKDMQLSGISPPLHVDKSTEEEKMVEDVLVPSREQLASGQSFPRFLRNLWLRIRSGNGEVIMLGPGMESPNTSKIFRRLLWTRPDLLITQRLLPGSQDGVGSGVELDFKGEKRFNLIALYSGNHRDRGRRSGLERLRQSNILEEDASQETTDGQQANGASADDVSVEVGSAIPNKSPMIKFHLRDPVFNFLKNREETYRLIYVVDATKSQPLSQIACNRLEIKAILDGIRSCENTKLDSTEPSDLENLPGNGESSPSHFSSFIGFTGHFSSNSQGSRRPVLVLSCVQDKTVPRISCVEIASLLDLASVTDRPWYVQDVTVDNLTGVENGLNWLFKQM
ncbi:F-box only protein 4-like isoform X1 [Clavelina lepadiformis]|uniref:F-box only protein 4-like isoform X1 n=2 Tax=Clavelina lepadiformis TaxID=159417 RepID=UPI0040432AB3